MDHFSPPFWHFETVLIFRSSAKSGAAMAGPGRYGSDAPAGGGSIERTLSLQYTLCSHSMPTQGGLSTGTFAAIPW